MSDYGIDIESCLDEYINDASLLYNEAYSGRTETLIKITNLLDIMSDQMRKAPEKDYTNSRENAQLCELLKKQFGFKSVYITWKRYPEAMSNVFTVSSLGALVDNSIKYDASKNSFYDSNHSLVVYINADVTIAKKLNISGAEYTAALLHEIGHNFDVSPYMLIKITWSLVRIITNIIYPIQIDIGGQYEMQYKVNFQAIMLLLLQTPVGHAAIGMLDKFVEKVSDLIPALKKFMIGVSAIASFLLRNIEKIKAPIRMITMVPKVILFSPLYQVKTFFTRKTEENADSFAVFYGYGNDLSKVLVKLENMNLHIDTVKNPINKVLTDIALAQREIINTAIGDHGSTDTRIYGNIKLIENEINSGNYPPEVVDELKKELVSLRKTYDGFIHCSENNKFVFTIFCRKTLSKLFNGRSDYIAKLFPAYTYTTIAESADNTESKDEKIFDMRNDANTALIALENGEISCEEALAKFIALSEELLNE